MIVRLCVARRQRWELGVAALLIALVTLAFAGGSFFDRDDLFFAAYFEVNPPTPSVLVRSWFGHLVPAYIASVIGFLTAFGLSWPAALVIISLINAGAFVALTRCLDAVLGPARLNVFAGLAFSLSLGPMIVRLWWAATLTNMLALALGLAVLGCATRWVVTRRTRHLVSALLLYALALAMSEKNLLFSMHIALWCVLVVWRGRPIRERVRKVLRTWPLWVGLATLSLIDVVAFLTGPYIDESGSAPGKLFSLHFIAQTVLGGLVPSVFGIEMVNETTSWLDPRVVVTVLLLAAFMVWTIVKVRSNGGVWIFAAIGAVANAAVLSRRGELIGLGGGRQVRYLLESSALLWLSIGVVLLVTLRTIKETERASESVRGARGVGGLVVTGGLVAVLAVSSWFWATGLQRAVQVSGGYAARSWVTSLDATLPREPIALIDSPLPTSFGMPALHPYDMVSLVLPKLGWHEAQATNVLDGAWAIGSDGVAGPATIASPDVQFSGSRCSEGTTAIAMPEIHTNGRTFLILDFSQASGDSITFATNAGWTTIERPSESGRVAVYVPGVIDGDLSIASADGTICVEAVTVGDIVPEESSAEGS